MRAAAFERPIAVACRVLRACLTSLSGAPIRHLLVSLFCWGREIFIRFASWRLLFGLPLFLSRPDRSVRWKKKTTPPSGAATINPTHCNFFSSFKDHRRDFSVNIFQRERDLIIVVACTRAKKDDLDQILSMH